MLNNRSTRGALLCIFSACLWGFTGTVGQFLFQQMGISSKWLASNRMLAAGILLLIYIYWRRGKEILIFGKIKKMLRYVVVQLNWDVVLAVRLFSCHRAFQCCYGYRSAIFSACYDCHLCFHTIS